jgi:hypothetical protein
MDHNSISVSIKPKMANNGPLGDLGIGDKIK